MDWFRRRPFTTAVLVILAIVVPGFWRVETIASEAHETAEDFQAAENREEAEEGREAIDACKVRNRATLNGRERFVILRRNLIALVADNPEEVAAIEGLFVDIPLDPSIEDRDCDGDRVLTDEDYAP